MAYKKIITIGFGFLLIVFVVGMFFSMTKRELTPVRVQLEWVHQADVAGLYVAKEKGFYEAEGLDVIITEFNFSDSNIVNELDQGATDFLIISAKEFLLARGEGKKIKAVSSIFQLSPYAFVALKESGIMTPADFRGNVLGETGGVIENTIAYNFVLNKYNIPKSEVVLKETGFNPLEELEENNADVVGAYRTNELFFFDQGNIAYNLILPEQYGFKAYGEVIATHERLIESDPKMVKRFVTATLKGWEYALKNTNEAIDYTMLYAIGPSFKSREHQEYLLEKSIPLIEPTGNQPLGIMNFSRWNQLYVAMENANLFKKEFEIKDAYTNQFIR